MKILDWPNVSNNVCTSARCFKTKELPVESISMVVVEIRNSVLQNLSFLAFLNRHKEDVDVGVQGKLVHGVYIGHVSQHKEED